MNQECKLIQGGRKGIILAIVRVNVKDWVVVLWDGDEMPIIEVPKNLRVRSMAWVTMKG